MIINKFLIRIILPILILLSANSPALAEKNLDSVTVEMKEGGSIKDLLLSVGINKADTANVIDELKNVYDIKKLNASQKIKINFEIMDEEGKQIRFSSMEIRVGKSKIQVTRLDSDIFFANVFESKNQPKLIYIHATVGATLFAAAMNAGLSHEMFNELVKAYSYDVDFQRDVVQGNELEVLYEGLYNEEGKLIGNGDILYTNLVVERGTFSIFRYTDKEGRTDFYTEDGESVRKSLLKTPVNGARISSGYGSRHHPILGFTKVHKGVDFAAPTGTPVYAAGNGIVVEMTRKGSYGKYIKIFHNGIYTTAYAHLNGYAQKLQRGSKVSQGQVIGYVGSTGKSTGPHLHYEVIEKGYHVNPLAMHAGSGKKLADAEKLLFLKHRDSLLGTAARMAAKSHEAVNDVVPGESKL